NPDVHFLDEHYDGAVLHAQQETEPATAHRKNSATTRAAHDVGSNEFGSASSSSATPAPVRSWANSALVALGIAVVISAGWLAYSACKVIPSKSDSASASATAPPVVTVTTAAATMKPVDEVLSVTGTISAWDELKVGVEVSGLHVKSVNVEEGDRVKKGQILAELNAGLLEAQLAQAEARLKSTQANLIKSYQPNRPEDIAGLKAALAQAESNILQEEAHRAQAKVGLESAEVNVPRYDGLAKIGAVSVVEAETKRFTRDNAKLELESADQKVSAAKRQAEQASHRLLLATHGGRAEDVLMMKASVDETKAQIKHLTEQIKQTKIRAHDDGMILARNVHIGDTSEIGKPFFIMSRQNRLELRAAVNDIDLQKFQPGQSVYISTNEHDKGKVIGKVRIISPQVDAGSRLGTVRIDLPGDSGLKPGMFVRGETRLTQHSGLTVPVSSLVTRGGESFVFTLDGNRAISTPVKTGMQSEEFVEITKGLTAGQLVVDKGARFLSDRDVVDLPQK
ncbi:MAG: efflux RND transporter periplasmic adaptor subunit, partial [Candidatus Obscuribacterales bacterium]|nr:efflux RND transporter periplasmic adaptor subunit [Candidatus Obscuribacterales bacterium]